MMPILQIRKTKALKGTWLTQDAVGGGTSISTLFFLTVKHVSIAIPMPPTKGVLGIAWVRSPLQPASRRSGLSST